MTPTTASADTEAPRDGLAEPVSAADLALLGGEQAYLLNLRSVSYTETFSRLSAFLAALGAATVTLGLIAAGIGFSDGFFVAVLVLLPVVGFLGLGCFIRLLELNTDDVKTILALNRLRHAYRDMAPRFERYLSGSVHDDEAGMMGTIQLGASRTTGSPLVHAFMVTAPATVGTINSILAAVLCVDLLLLAHSGPLAAVAVGVVGFALAFAWHARRQWLAWDLVRRAWQPRFPMPTEP